MKKRILKTAVAVAAIITVLFPTVCTYASDGTSYVYDGFVYDSWGNVQASPAAFELEKIIDSNSMEDYDFQSLEDVSTSADGRMFLSDRLSGRVFVFDQNGSFLQSIKTLRDADTGKIALNEDGSQVVLSMPSGTYYHEKNQELYIADTGNKTVYILDGETYAMKRRITTPENMTGVTEFVPSKVTVDYADRIYIVVASSYEGIIELNSDGTFSRYFGVNEPGINYIQQFWKSFATDAQKEKMGKTYAPAFTNVVMDYEGFVYAVTNDASAANFVFRLNSAGKNVLRQEGFFPVVGDLNNLSSLVDVAVTDYGTYAVLDDAKGRVYLYDYDGQILNVFGGYGQTKGQFKKPTAIAWLGDKLIITDTDLKCAFMLRPTDFGDVALRASRAYYFGRWDEATELFLECIRLNGNYEVAYIGVGKNYLMMDEYEKAMYYFKLGNSKPYYSDAYNGFRGEQIREHFYIVAIAFAALMTWLVISEVRYRKKNPV